MRSYLNAAIAIAAITSAACGGGNHSPTAPTTPSTSAVSSVSVTGASTSASSFQLTATARFADGTSQDVTGAAQWSSSNTGVATVSAGVVSVVGSGEIDVRATYQTVTGSTHLLIARVPVASVSITGGSASGSFQLTATARLSDGSSVDVTRSAAWQSSNAQIAAVSPTGFVTVLTSGDVDVVASYQGTTGTRHYSVSLPKAFALSGVVRSTGDGEPVANATVRILGSQIPAATTNAAGAFAFNAVAAGRVLVEVTRAGFSPWENDALIVDRDVEMNVALTPMPSTTARR